MTLPLIMTIAGPQPTPLDQLQQALIAQVKSTDPDYTANLPGSLIEDISSTDVAAMTQMDQARVDAVNSVTPYGANAAVLAQLGVMFGLPQGLPSNASALVVFSGSVGYVISPGFLVSDGTNQYAVQDGGVVLSSGQTAPLSVVATNANTFPVPAGSITQVVTSVASGYTLTVTNPNAGTPATAAESVTSYRARVLTAFAASSTGTPALIQTLIAAISGVALNSVGMLQAPNGWEVLQSGGDAYAVANAILNAVPDLSVLQGSQLAITGMTAANPVVVTTNYPSGLAAGATFTVAGATPSAYNVTYTVASVAGTKITTTTNGSSFGAYSSGATFNPNPRNVSVSVFQNPNTYDVLFVQPATHQVQLTAQWNTSLPNFTAQSTVNQLGTTALTNYLNALAVGQPINFLAMTAVFQQAVATLIATPNLTDLTFSVTIDGVAMTPDAGTDVVQVDPEGLFNAQTVTVEQA